MPASVRFRPLSACFAVGVAACTAAPAGAGGGCQGCVEAPPTVDVTVVRESDGFAPAVMPDGTIEWAQTWHIAKSHCYVGAHRDEAGLRADLDRHIRRVNGEFFEPDWQTVVGPDGVIFDGPYQDGGIVTPTGADGPTATLNFTGGNAATRAAAVQAIGVYTELFADPINIEVDLTFTSAIGGGATLSTFSGLTYTSVRNALALDMDEDDTIQTSLPVNSVRYDLGPSIVFGSAVLVSSPTAAAIDISLTGSPIITIFATLGADYNLDDGLRRNNISGIDLLVHEFGHALGFLSGLDPNETFAPTVLDLFRFEDAAAPATPNAFFNAVRFADAAPASIGDHVFADTDTTASLSNGSDAQSSHWLDVPSPTGIIGTMDPIIAVNQTLSPEFLSPADIAAFDAIGFEYVAPPDVPECPADISGNGVLDVFDLIPFLVRFNELDPSADFNNDGAIDVFDLIDYLVAFSAGCPD